AAWLMGIRKTEALAGGEDETKISVRLTRLLSDKDPFVRRRAAEAFTRVHRPISEDVASALVARLGDADRLVAYTAMIALAHRSRSEWLRKPVPDPPQTLLRWSLTAR